MKKVIVSVVVYVIVFFAIQCAATLGIQQLWRVATGSPDITAMQLVVSMGVSSVVTLAVFLSARWAVVSNRYILSRPWAVVAWSGLAAVGAIVPSSWLQEQMPELPNILVGQFDMILRNRWGYLAVGLLAPVAEEIVFRGAVLRSLLKWSKHHWIGIAISAVLFALFHGNPAQMPHAFMVGLLLGWMFYRTGSVVPCVAYHWVNNTLAYILYNVMPNPDAPLVTLFGGSERTVYMALLFSLCILVPSLFQLNARMKRA